MVLHRYQIGNLQVILRRYVAQWTAQCVDPENLNFRLHHPNVVALVVFVKRRRVAKLITPLFH